MPRPTYLSVHHVMMVTAEDFLVLLEDAVFVACTHKMKVGRTAACAAAHRSTVLETTLTFLKRNIKVVVVEVVVVVVVVVVE